MANSENESGFYGHLQLAVDIFVLIFKVLGEIFYSSVSIFISKELKDVSGETVLVSAI